jgi:exopolysaccharide biosynthesis polyprenyl glycosylphosphotransferase
MKTVSKKEPVLLLIGDLAILFVALWLGLLVRYAGEIPANASYAIHLKAFVYVFIISIISFYVAGLYDRKATLLRSKISYMLFNAQIANAAVAMALFYFIPFFTITPKVNLFIYLGLSFGLLLFWRLQIAPQLAGVRNVERGLILGSGNEIKALQDELNRDSLYNLKIVGIIDVVGKTEQNLREEIKHYIENKNVSVVVIDTKKEQFAPLFSYLYDLFLHNVRFVDLNRMYEELFYAIPTSLVTHGWFLENISLARKGIYDFAKRIMDIVIGSVAGLLSLVVYPFVFVAIKFDDGGSIFIVQERVGQNDALIKTYKFRTMHRNEVDLKKGGDNAVTRVGAFLRKTRIDELPQLWNVVMGDVSLIGPRPELPSGVQLYEAEIPFYAIRHLIKPGLSGWAQIYGDHPHHGHNVTMTKNKLSYDLYYLKNRSLFLDIQIALKTIKKMLSRSGI